jgi:uncharacterized delta-60 repeat protein
MALQPDGKILAVGEIIDGTSHWYFGVFRYLPDGTLDPSFGERGFAELQIGTVSFANAVAVQRDGRIVVAGEGSCPRAICFAAARFMPDGTVDRSFGEGGVVRTMFSQCGCRAYDVAVQQDGRIVLAGMRQRGGDAQDDELFAVARYLPDGRLDQTFSGDGRASVDFGFGDDEAFAVAVQPDGRLVVAGGGTRNRYRTEDDFAFARFRRDGTLDRSFSGDGRATVDFGHRRSDTVHGLALGRNGRIVAAGSSGKKDAPPRIAVVRLAGNGRLESRRLTSPGPFGGYALAAVQQSDGGVVVAGRAFEDNRFDSSDWVVARYGPGGALDRSFGRSGLVVSDFGTGADWAGALALQPNGRIVVAGSIYESQALARYR